jgi:hypothetical protein
MASYLREEAPHGTFIPVGQKFPLGRPKANPSFKTKLGFARRAER